MNAARCFMFLVSLSLLASAQAAQKTPSGIWLDHESMARRKLPRTGDIPYLIDDLEYLKNEVPMALVMDINGDGIDDYLIESSERLCGTGGCLYALVDGKTKKRSGDFFGSPILIVDQKINGYPVVQSYGHLNSESGSFATYVFDGKKYQMVGNVYVQGKSLEELFKGLAAFKKIRAASPKPSR